MRIDWSVYRLPDNEDNQNSGSNKTNSNRKMDNLTIMIYSANDTEWYRKQVNLHKRARWKEQGQQRQGHQRNSNKKQRRTRRTRGQEEQEEEQEEEEEEEEAEEEEEEEEEEQKQGAGHLSRPPLLLLFDITLKTTS